MYFPDLTGKLILLDSRGKNNDVVPGFYYVIKQSGTTITLDRKFVVDRLCFEGCSHDIDLLGTWYSDYVKVIC
jgi:hypothetical protein